MPVSDLFAVISFQFSFLFHFENMLEEKIATWSWNCFFIIVLKKEIRLCFEVLLSITDNLRVVSAQHYVFDAYVTSELVHMRCGAAMYRRVGYDKVQLMISIIDDWSIKPFAVVLASKSRFVFMYSLSVSLTIHCFGSRVLCAQFYIIKTCLSIRTIEFTNQTLVSDPPH